MEQRASVLLIYTGGTIGMTTDPETGSLRPFDFDHLYKHVPEIKQFDIDLEVVAFEDPIDSSDMSQETWVHIAKLIQTHYDEVDGFVILHGSDTMAYTASALSFMLEDLNKPVILTGSQLPIGVIRTDGKENLITAIEIAASKRGGIPIVPEVAVYFEYKLYRGNRTIKASAEHFEAFDSPNYPLLANAGVDINFNVEAIKKMSDRSLIVHSSLNANIAVLKLFPGIPESVIKSHLAIPGLRAVVMETYGSGNAPTSKWLLKLLREAIENGLLVVNVTQCNRGTVNQGRYQTSAGLVSAGVVNGLDMTTEAAITKLMLLLGSGRSTAEIAALVSTSICGELTPLASV